MEEYIRTIQPSVYDDFMGTAAQVLTAAHQKSLHKLLEFRFKRHPRYNLPPARLNMIENQIRKRARELL